MAATPPTTAEIVRSDYTPDVIYANPSGGPFLLFVFMNVFLLVCMTVIILYLVKSQKDFAARMNAMRKDRGRKAERVADRTVFDFHHSPEEAEILETHERVLAAFKLEDDGDLDNSDSLQKNPLAGAPSGRPGNQANGNHNVANRKREPGKKLSPFEL